MHVPRHTQLALPLGHHSEQWQWECGEIEGPWDAGTVLDGQFLDYNNFAKLEKMPTKQELIRTIAIMIKKVPTKVATSINAVPTKLGRAINLLAEGIGERIGFTGEVAAQGRIATADDGKVRAGCRGRSQQILGDLAIKHLCSGKRQAARVG